MSVHVCGVYPVPSHLIRMTQYSTLAFEALLLALAVVYYIHDVFESRRLLGPQMWRVNSLLRLLVWDSTIYFAM